MLGIILPIFVNIAKDESNCAGLHAKIVEPHPIFFKYVILLSGPSINRIFLFKFVQNIYLLTTNSEHMKTIKSFFLTTSLFALTFANIGCSDDDDKNESVEMPPTASIVNVTATVTGISDLVDHVYLSKDDFGKDIFTRSAFQDNKFTFDLSKVNVDDKYLYPISSDEIYKNHIISDRAAKMTYGQFIGFNDSKPVGLFNYTQKNQIFGKSAYYVYVDRDVTVTGKFEKSKNVFIVTNCSFLKGWNQVNFYAEESEKQHTDIWITASFDGLKWEYIAFK